MTPSDESQNSVDRANKFRFRSLKGTYVREFGVKALLTLCAVLSIFTTVAIIAVLAIETSRFFQADRVVCNNQITRDGESVVCGTYVATSTSETAGDIVHLRPAPGAAEQ